jgi:hypothetical protein
MSISINSVGSLSMYYGMSSLASSSFSTIDTSGDDSIDKDELSTYLSKTSGTTPDASDLISDMDTDGDAAVSEDEFTAFADAKKQQLELVLKVRESIADAQEKLVKSIGGDDSSDDSSSAASTANSIISKYAENLNSETEDAISSLVDVEA